MIAVTKFERMLTSLVAAVPAAMLSFLLIMAMLRFSENLSAVAYVVIGMTLISVTAVALLPVGILLATEAKGPSEAPAARYKESDDIEAVDADVEMTGLSSDSLADQDVLDASEFDLGDSGEEIFVDESEEVAAEENIDTDALDDFSFDDEEQDEPPAKPKKKKR